MENHYYDEHGAYTSSAPANPGTLPPDGALRLTPPRRDGFWPIVNDTGDEWTLVEDNRGRQGWLDGERVEIKELGPLPAGWRDTPPSPPEITDPVELRRMAFAAEADQLRDAALSYRLEAEALTAAGDIVAAAEAERKYQRELAAYRDVKKDIRVRYPKAAVVTNEEPVQKQEAARAEDSMVFLTPSGTYHQKGCRYTNGNGNWLRLSEMKQAHPKAKACGACGR